MISWLGFQACSHQHDNSQLRTLDSIPYHADECYT
jgi:hypothetical protein